MALGPLASRHSSRRGPAAPPTVQAFRFALSIPGSRRGFGTSGSNGVSGFPAPSQGTAGPDSHCPSPRAEQRRSTGFRASPSLEPPQLTAENPAPPFGSTAASTGQTCDFPRAHGQTAGASRDREEDKARRGSNTQQALPGAPKQSPITGETLTARGGPGAYGQGATDAGRSATASVSAPAPKYICPNPKHQR